PTRHNPVRDQHDFGLWLLCDQSAGTGSVRWAAQRKSVAQPCGVRDATGGDDDRANRLQPARRRPCPIRWSRIPPSGLLVVQEFPTYGEVPFGISFGVFQPNEPSELYESRIRRQWRDCGAWITELFEREFRPNHIDT